MIEYLYLFCLLCLTISVPVLIRGCFNIHKELPHQGGNISEKIDGVNDILNELADFISDVANGINSSPVNTNPPTLVDTLLTAFLKRGSPSPLEHGKTQPQDWEILPPNDTQTNETETIIDEYSTINNGG
jgi:hypothetical protein